MAFVQHRDLPSNNMCGQYSQCPDVLSASSDASIDIARDVSSIDCSASTTSPQPHKPTTAEASQAATSTPVTSNMTSRKRIVSEMSLHQEPQPVSSISSSTSSTQQSKLQQLIHEEQLNHTTQHDQIALFNYADSIHNQVWRERVSQWCYDVTDYLEESREVAYVAMNFMDRYTSVLDAETDAGSSSINQFDYEVFAFTSLFLAIRVCGNNKNIQIPELLELSSSGAQARHILAAGNSMLQKLSWNHRIVTPHVFVKELLKVFVQMYNNTNEQNNGLSQEQALILMDFAFYLVELSVCDARFSSMAPSEIAFASLALAVTCNQDFASNSNAQKIFAAFGQFVQTQTTMDIDSVHIKSIISRLLDVYKQSQEAVESSSSAIIPENNDSNTNMFTPPHIISDDDADHEDLQAIIDEDDEDVVMDTTTIRPISPE